MLRRSRGSPVFTALALVVAATTLSWSDTASGDADSPSPLASTSCSPNDITTGGGWILSAGQGKQTFGFEAGFGPSAPVPGRLVFVDRAANERLVGRILVYTPNPTNTRLMLGTGQVSQETVAFELRVADNSGTGQPDTFSLSYVTSRGAGGGTGPLGGGNIQIHHTCP
jgi:hypothetical protein